MKNLKFFLVMLLIWLVNLVQAQTYMAQVFSVTDGDTFTILYSGKKIRCRMANIDCPETTQPFGLQARDSLTALILNKQITFTYLGTDPYNRWIIDSKIGSVSLDSLEIARGWAWHYKTYSHKSWLGTLESNARSLGLGLWACPESMEPWQYRRLSKKGHVIFETLMCN